VSVCLCVCVCCVCVCVRVCVTSLIAEAIESLRPRLLPGETVDARRT
jgi:hypothetical protein